MGVTKIWPIKDSAKRLVEYVKNPKKQNMRTFKQWFTM